MNKYNSLIQDIRKILKTYKEFNPVIGGTTSLYLQGCNLREPHDIDIFFPITKSEFLDKVHSSHINIPDTINSLDWGFFPNVNYRVVLINGIPCQRVDDILTYKEEYEDVCPGGNCTKHNRDVVFLKKWLRNKSINELSKVKQDLENSEDATKESFNKVVKYLSTKYSC